MSVDLPVAGETPWDAKLNAAIAGIDADLQTTKGKIHTVQDEGTPRTARAGLNFVGAGVTATDDAANNRTTITIPGGSGGGGGITSYLACSRATSFAVPNGSLTGIPMTATEGSGGTDLTRSAGGWITVSTAGMYHFGGSMYLSGVNRTSCSTGVTLYRSSAAVTTYDIGGLGGPTYGEFETNGSFVLPLQAGDELRLTAYTNSPATAVAGYLFLWAMKLG